VLEHRSSHRVERVTGAAGLADYLAVATAVWRERPGYAGWLEQELHDHPNEISLHVAYVEGVPVAGARASYPRDSQFAGLWGGATLPAHRGKGLYRALVKARAILAAQRGFTYLMVDALETSRPTLARFGFERLSASRPCLWSPPLTRPAHEG
jgi:GNAT superfamily N-acetyltransferase